MTTLDQLPLSDVVSEVSDLVQDGKSETQAFIKALANQALSLAAKAHDFPQLLKLETIGVQNLADSATKPVLSSSPYFSAPTRATKVVAAWDLGAGGKPLQEMTAGNAIDRWVGADADNIDSGASRPLYYARVGSTAQYRALISDGKLTVKSSSDQNSSLECRVYFRKAAGILGEEVYEDVTGDFSAGVEMTVPAEAGWTVTRVIVPPGWKGSVTLEDTGGRIIAAMQNPEEPNATANTRARHLQRNLYRVFPAPSGDIGVGFLCKSTPLRLVDDGDVPEIPVHNFMVWKAASMLMRARRYGTLAREFSNQAREHLIAAVVENPTTYELDGVAKVMGSEGTSS